MLNTKNRLNSAKMRLYLFLAVLFIFGTSPVFAQQNFNGIDVNMSNLYRMSDAQTRSISPENFTGEKGKGGMATTGTGANAARDLGQKWKVNPFVDVKKGATFTLAEMDGPGSVQHIWLTPTGNWRSQILRFYWDDESTPSVEVPLGDFFCMGWGKYSPVTSLAVNVNPGSAFNCYWPMPFRKKCRITLENKSDADVRVYYQIDYVLTKVPDDAAYFHAQFRRANPLAYKKDFVLLDGVKGRGQYVGTYMAYGSQKNGWWGEGEIKFFMDGDSEFPTINGTGTEDYFCGSYDFATTKKNSAGVDVRTYTEFSGPYTGMLQVLGGDGAYQVAGQRFGLYRWHITDPVRFNKSLRVTIQDLGWHHDGRYMPLQDDIATTVFWYQTEPHAHFPPLPGKDELEVN